MTRTVEDFLFRGNNSTKKIDPKRCARGVTDNDRSAWYHQCGNKPSEMIGGYGFCAVHLLEIKNALGLNTDTGVVKYIAGKGRFDVYIERATVLSETGKTITASNVEAIYGSRYNYGARINKSDVHIFDTATEAAKWVADMLRRMAERSQAEADSLSARANSIEGVIKERYNGR